MILSRLLVVVSFFSVLALAQLGVNHTGTLFWFGPGLGACGFTNTSQQVVASVSSTFFNTFPGHTANPNNNPLCKLDVLVSIGARSTVAAIVDFFDDNAPTNIGLSQLGFMKFAPLDDGLVPGVTWSVRNRTIAV